jgi:hypothetical protein
MKPAAPWSRPPPDVPAARKRGFKTQPHWDSQAGMPAADAIRETDLYEPVKLMLEAQGFAVKAEVGPADVVGCREGEEPVIVELKTRFSLALFHQAVERMKLSDAVYIAVPRGTGVAFRKSLKANIALCRRLGLGLITVRLKDGLVEVHAEPGPYAPRKAGRRRQMLLREFARRDGDPNTGGQTRMTVMTAYRQDAIRCAGVLAANGAMKASNVAKAADVERARVIMADNHYGWFERVSRGVYGLSEAGRNALQDG